MSCGSGVIAPPPGDDPLQYGFKHGIANRDEQPEADDLVCRPRSSVSKESKGHGTTDQSVPDQPTGKGHRLLWLDALWFMGHGCSP